MGQEPEDAAAWGFICSELSMGGAPSPWEKDTYHTVTFYTEGNLGSDTRSPYLTSSLWRVWAFVALRRPLGLGEPRSHIPYSFPDLVHFRKIQTPCPLPDDRAQKSLT